MFFILDESIDEAIADAQHPNHDEVFFEIERLAHARWRQKIVAFPESTQLSRLVSDSPRFSQRAKSVVGHLHRSRTFKRELLFRISVRVRLTALGTVCSVNSVAGITEISVPLALVPHGLFESPILLAENINDAKCYLILARMATTAKTYGLPRIGLNGELRGGGGSAIEVEYKQIKTAMERVVLCVLDSDLRFPGCPPSAWRQRMLDDDNLNPSPIAASFSTGVYSIESLLPLDSFPSLRAYKCDAAKSHVLAGDVVHWRSHAQREYWPFIPLKKSISCRVFRVQGDEGDYWRGHTVSFAGYSSKNCAGDLGSCRNECLKAPKYPSDVLAEFVEELDGAPTASLMAFAQSVPTAAAPHLAEVAKRVIAWFCVGGPIGVAGAG